MHNEGRFRPFCPRCTHRKRFLFFLTRSIAVVNVVNVFACTWRSYLAVHHEIQNFRTFFFTPRDAWWEITSQASSDTDSSVFVSFILKNRNISCRGNVRVQGEVARARTRPSGKRQSPTRDDPAGTRAVRPTLFEKLNRQRQCFPPWGRRGQVTGNGIWHRLNRRGRLAITVSEHATWQESH